MIIYRFSVTLAVSVMALSGAGSARRVNGDDRADHKTQSAAKKSKLEKQARITMERAREIALAKAPGTVEEEELEREHGKLVYSFDIRNDRGEITEVQVNAKDGSVVSVEEEDEQKEAEEKRKDKEEKARSKQP